jgi:two-component system, NarL family, nitrate/nitrite response regulator NarL
VKPPRVVIADDHPPTRMGVRLALEEDGFIVCGEEDTGPGAVAAALRDPPDVCLLDVDMPGGGIEAAAAIRAQLPQTHVVMLSAAENDDELFAALEVGASGYLLKEMNPARLGRALQGVLRGEAALPRALTARLIEEFRARAQHPSLVRRSEKDLTSREWDVLDCLRDGLSTRRIAKQLFISETTVRRHVGSILRKLGVSSREEAVQVAARRSRNLNGE